MKNTDDQTETFAFRDTALGVLLIGLLFLVLAVGVAVSLAIKPPGIAGWLVAFALTSALAVVATKGLVVLHRRLRPIRTDQRVVHTLAAGEQPCLSCESLQTALVAELRGDRRRIEHHFVCFNCGDDRPVGLANAA